MKFSKTIIASLLGLTLATSVMAAEKQHQMIKIEATDNGPAEISITQNGELQVFTISQAALKDKELLLSELSVVSEEVQQHISQALSSLHYVGEAHIEIEQEYDGERHIVDNQEDFAFVTIDDENTKEMKVIVKQAHGLHFDTEKGASFNAIVHLLKSTELSAEQLNTLQEILDSKR